ncbi:MAG: selenium-dependent xanthine dehydrogenase [candidate division KSB1 bacterium]|nr:selenium-dependent xanthine dehydrogenase [candidate division KSB1 bacterium]
MQFKINGRLRQFDGDPNMSLLQYLREVDGILSPKDGCSPQAACGACTVELNGRAVLSCVIPMEKVADGEVITLEGIGEEKRRVFAHAFVAKGGVQCGFCIPGFVMQAKVLLDHHPAPTRDKVEKAVTPNLCRCTGYKKIIDAILYAAEALREGWDIPRPEPVGGIGTNQPKYEADKLVLGERPFVADLTFDGMVYGALKFSDHPRARVLAIDTSEAEKLPGVLRVFTAEDIPGERFIGLIVNDWPLMVAAGEETRYVGDVLAGVVAESEDVARRAVERIRIEYEVLPPVTDPHEALKPESPRVHEKGNLLSETIIKRGPVDELLQRSAHVVHGVYRTQMIEHAYLEPECSIARPVDAGVEVYSQGQGVYEDQRQIARVLGTDLERVRVVLVPNGGGFGGKEDLSIQGHAALFAHLLQRPVKITLTRDESIRMHPKRHPLWMEYTVGCDENGRLTALKARIIGDTGAYASVGAKVLERAAGHATGAYHIPAVDIESRAVYTNNIPCGAMRGFGVNQVTFAIESCIDELCEKGGFDRWQFRYDNALTDGGMTATGQIIRGGCGLRETLLAVKEAFQNARYAGIACGIKNTGIGNGMPDEGTVKIEIAAPDRVIVHHGWTEMGQGVHTMAVQFLSHATGIDPQKIEVRVDTAAKAPAGMTTASRATSIIGNAIFEAAQALKRDLETQPLAALVGRVYEGQWRCDWTTKPEAEVEEVITHYSYSYATQVAILNDEGVVEKVIAAHDAGKIINPLLFEGQIEGSVHMGLGYALREELVMENGRPKSTRLRKMGVLRAKEMPEVEVIGVEVPDPHGPAGAKGVGEIGLVPTAAAVANAFYQYDGVRRYSLPLQTGWRKAVRKKELAEVATG